jgi:hypothetical protein
LAVIAALIPAELAALSAALAAAFGPGQVKAQTLLQRSDRAQVARGVMGGQPVIIKQFTGPDPAATIAALQAEHAVIAPHLATGRFRLATALRLDAARGLAVLPHAPGDRLDGVLARATPTERAAVIAQAGGWLAAFTAPRRHLAPMNLHTVLRRRKDAMAASPPHPADQPLTGTAFARLRTLARDLAGADLVQSGIHADFTPYNLHLSGVELWGFDLQGTRIRPVALDVASFLVLAGLRLPPTDPGPLAHGLPLADAQAFLAACPDAGGPVLDFFLGDRLLRALHEATTPARATAARTALQGWLG